MALELHAVSSNSQFRQGEVLASSNELSFSKGPISIDSHSDAPAEAVVIPHKFVLLLSPDCDLEQDFKSRVVADPAFEHHYRSADERNSFRDRGEKNQLTNVLAAPLWLMEEFKKRADNRTYNQVTKSNNHPRWCRIGPMRWQSLPPSSEDQTLLLDCGYIFTWPMQLAHEFLRKSAKRIGRLPSPYREHFLQRLFYWQMRIGVEDL